MFPKFLILSLLLPTFKFKSLTLPSLPEENHVSFIKTNHPKTEIQQFYKQCENKTISPQVDHLVALLSSGIKSNEVLLKCLINKSENLKQQTRVKRYKHENSWNLYETKPRVPQSHQQMISNLEDQLDRLKKLQNQGRREKHIFNGGDKVETKDTGINKTEINVKKSEAGENSKDMDEIQHLMKNISNHHHVSGETTSKAVKELLKTIRIDKEMADSFAIFLKNVTKSKEAVQMTRTLLSEAARFENGSIPLMEPLFAQSINETGSSQNPIGTEGRESDTPLSPRATNENKELLRRLLQKATKQSKTDSESISQELGDLVLSDLLDEPKPSPDDEVSNNLRILLNQLQKPVTEKPDKFTDAEFQVEIEMLKKNNEELKGLLLQVLQNKTVPESRIVAIEEPKPENLQLQINQLTRAIQNMKAQYGNEPDPTPLFNLDPDPPRRDVVDIRRDDSKPDYYSRISNTSNPSNYLHQVKQLYNKMYSRSNEYDQQVEYSSDNKEADSFGDKIFRRIVEKILRKVGIFFEVLFGSSVDGNSGYKNDNYSLFNGVFGSVFQNLGFLGVIPMIIVRLIGAFVKMFQGLRKIPFFRTFLIPAGALLLLNGVVIFLVWWLQLEDEGGSSYSQDYNNYQEPPNYEQPSSY